MLVSFIISQRKSIPAIRRAVEPLGAVWRAAAAIAKGRCMRSRQQKRSAAGEQALQECGLGYRTRYVLHAAQQAAEGTLDLKKLASCLDEALLPV